VPPILFRLLRRKAPTGVSPFSPPATPPSLTAGVPARNTQQPNRVLIVPDDALGRVTQQPNRVLIVPDDALARVTMMPVRTLVAISTASAARTLVMWHE